MKCTDDGRPREDFFRRWRDLCGVLRVVAADSDYDTAQTQAVATVERLRRELKEALVVVAAQDKAIAATRIYMETQRCTEHAVAASRCAACNTETRALGLMADAVGDVPA